MSLIAVQKRVGLESRRRNQSVPEKAKRILAKLANGETGGTTVLPIVPHEEDPEGEEISVEGTIYGVNRVNLYRRTGIAETVVGRALLGDLGKQPLVEIVLRGDRDPETGFVNEFKVFVYEKVWQNSGLRQRDFAEAGLQKRTFTTGAQIWFAEKIGHARQ